MYLRGFNNRQFCYKQENTSIKDTNGCLLKRQMIYFVSKNIVNKAILNVYLCFTLNRLASEDLEYIVHKV